MYSVLDIHGMFEPVWKLGEILLLMACKLSSDNEKFERAIGTPKLLGRNTGLGLGCTKGNQFPGFRIDGKAFE